MQGGRRAGSVLAHTLHCTYTQYICALLRDKFLRKKGGLILPNETSLYMAGIENEELRQVRALVGGIVVETQRPENSKKSQPNFFGGKTPKFLYNTQFSFKNIEFLQ